MKTGCWLTLLTAVMVLASVSLGRPENRIPDKAILRAPTEASSETRQVAVGDLYAVLVGISIYKDSTIPQLRVSAKDAKDLGEFLKTQEGTLFRKVHWAQITDSGATKREVDRQLRYELLRAGKDDTVIVFVSGHGSADTSAPGEFFFLTHDADPRFPATTGVNLHQHWEFLTKRLESRRVLLLADACYAAGLTHTKAITRARDSLMDLFKEAEGKVCIASSRADEFSQEKPDVGNSVFTHHVIEGLKGKADRNADGVVTLDELYEYVYRETRESTRGHQSPKMIGDIQGRFPIAVVSLRPGGTGISPENTALSVAEVWLALIDQGKYEESWREAASFFKKSFTAAGWSSMVRPIRTQLGKCNSRTVKSKQYMTQVPGAPAGEYVIVEFNASFANKPAAVERVTPMLDKDGKWRVSGYFMVK